MLTVTYDETTGIVCTVANGLASVEQFDTYVPSVRALMARSRSRHGRSLHLVDAGTNPVQAKGTFEHMANATNEAIRESDRCGVIMHSALARMQIARMPAGVGRRFFGNRADAIAWLLAEAAIPIPRDVEKHHARV
jgi:hypothetical protein